MHIRKQFRKPKGHPRQSGKAPSSIPGESGGLSRAWVRKNGLSRIGEKKVGVRKTGEPWRIKEVGGVGLFPHQVVGFAPVLAQPVCTF